MVKNEIDDCVLTIADAITAGDTNDLAAKRIRKLAGLHKNFGSYALWEMDLHMKDVYELGKDWCVAQEAFCLAFRSPKDWFRTKHPDLVQNMLRQATMGLKQLDPRFDVMTVGILETRPELVYMGLVQLLVEHKAKAEVVRHHRHYLVVRDSRPVAA